MSSAHGRLERAWAAAAEGLVFAVTGFVCSYTVADPDLWGHVRFGQDMWRAGAVLRTDSYSYLTAGHPWINHEWLAELSMALAWDHLGAPGLVALKLGIVWATVAVALTHLRWRGVSLLASAIVVLCGWLLMLPWLTALRPQAFTYFGAAVVLTLVSRAGEGRTGVLWWAVPLCAVWANVHGGFVAGLALLVVWLAARLSHLAIARGMTHPATRRALFGCGLPVCAAVAATLLTPYGVSLWTFLRSALDSRAEIAEWNPVDIVSVEGAAHAALLVPAAAGWLLSREPRSPALATVFLCTLVAPFAARRHTPLLALAVIMLAGEHMADVASHWLARQPAGAPSRTRGPRPAERAVLVAALAALSSVFAVLGVRHFARVDIRPAEYPVAATRLLADAGVRADMVTFFDWGEYVIWHLAPAVRVSMDGRRETVYPEAVYADDQRFLYGIGHWDALLDRGAPSLVLMSPRFAADNLMRLLPGWRVAYNDRHSTLFVRRGTEQERRLAALPSPAPPPDDVFLAFP